MRSVPKLTALSESQAWQFRRAQSVNEDLLSVICNVCKSNKKVRSCLLLDGRRHGEGQIQLFIVLFLDEGVKFLPQVAAQLQDALAAFPEQAKKICITDSSSFEKYADAVFYER